ncbi:transcription/translation regulatory transformer protein RfaH [Psychromonas ossibalaenae]|uniref:transcription/translation regulatory transformer protein RfaH n=1 Tax=Psychromonas ossibalaenae TaxID=444922 RepID=UPI0003707D72|nr:transcription/translation regulatory transformer protein RfaH [Psychromonas ossibalaenae]
MNKQWFVVYCKSREESRAQLHLQNQGIHSFFPKIRKEKIIRGKRSTVEEALFPSYLFIFVDQEYTNFSKIRSTRGINDFVKFGREIARVSEETIKRLENACHSINDLKADTQSLFKSGDKVEIKSGSFKGLSAIFEAQDGLERSMLLLNILNQENKISFCNKEIKKAES